MKNFKNATFMILSACMLFLSSCAQPSLCYKTDANGNQVYDANGNPVTYECNTTNQNNNSNWNGGVLTSTQRLIPVANAIPSFYADANRAYVDNNHDGIADYTLNPWTGDKSYKRDKVTTPIYSVNQGGIPYISSYAIMEDADARNFSNGLGSTKYQVMVIGGIKYYVVTVVAFNSILGYKSINQFDQVTDPFNFKVE